MNQEKYLELENKMLELSIRVKETEAEINAFNEIKDTLSPEERLERALYFEKLKEKINNEFAEIGEKLEKLKPDEKT